MEMISYNPRHSSSSSKSSNGCWTCKLRKKKCDATTPVPRICDTLLITCHYQADKPEWMEGGLKQERMAAHMKREDKDNARFHSTTAVPVMMQQMVGSMIASEPIIPPTIASERDHPNPPLPIYQQNSRSNPTIEVQLSEQDCMLVDESVSRGGLYRMDSVLMMFYIEHIFAFLFPFYDPPVLESGKA